MKYIVAVLALLVSLSANAQDKKYIAYWSAQGESMILLREPCMRQDFPASAKKATYVAYMQMIEGCYVMTGPDEVVVTMPNGQSVKLYRHQFKVWEIN